MVINILSKKLYYGGMGLAYILLQKIIRGIEMKVAITVWGNRISPVFDSAHTLLIADIENRKIIKRYYESFDPEISSHLVEKLELMDISILICGAISDVLAEIIASSKIELIPFISGSAFSILENFALERPIIPAFLMPGCRGWHGQRKKTCYYNIPYKEVSDMPRRDGTGPDGQGPATGRGQGRCRTENNSQGQGRGQSKGAGRGQGKGNGGRGQGR